MLTVAQNNKNLKWRVMAKSGDPQPKIRMSHEMWELLKNKSEENGRTFNNEVLVRLAQSLYAEERDE